MYKSQLSSDIEITNTSDRQLSFKVDWQPTLNRLMQPVEDSGGMD